LALKSFQFVQYLILTGILVSLLAASLTAQEPQARPSLSAIRVVADSGDVVLDGLLNEPIWQTGPAASGFRQREPMDGAPASEATEVRVVYDETTIYIGVLAHDSRPDAIISRLLQRDKLMSADEFGGTPQFGGDDAVAIVFDTFHDHRNGSVFATNPNGAEFEALITDEGREFNIDWRTVWQVKAQRTPEGWSAEFAIPFRSLRFPAGSSGDSWGFNVYRVIRRKNEEVLWSGWSRSTEGFHRISAAGHLENLTNLPRAGLNVEAKPYLLVGATQEQEDSNIDTDPRLEVGVDAKYEVRPGLVLDMTVNTDFAQVEVDDEQVNLTRFSLFFPEKREFFLENAGIFEFGIRSALEPPPFLLFFSRQIGIAEDGEVPVLGGLRLTGRVGGQTIGLLNVVTDSAYDQALTNFSVARVKRDIGDRHFIGAMLTDRRDHNGWNTAGGVDWSFWPTGTVNVQGFGVRTGTSGEGGDDFAYRMNVDFSTDRIGGNLQHMMIGPEIAADVGFVTRTDIRRTDGHLRLSPRPSILGLRKVDLFTNFNVLTHLDGVLQDWAVGGAISPQWSSGESLMLWYSRGFNRVDEGFELGDDVEVPAGDYDLWQLFFFANTSGNRPIVVGAQSIIQGTFGGKMLSLNGDLTVNPNANVSITARFNHNVVDVPDGSFTADVVSVRLAYAFSTRLYANTLLQYNNLDNSVSANVRLNFIHSPGSDLFIVFNERRGNDNSLWSFSDRGAVVKVTYLGRF
jgi:hypothetical protein